MKKKTLVIVESPTKSTTISRYLGEDYIVSSSMGHVRDLNPNILSIDVNNGYKPYYEELSDKKHIIKEIKSLSRKSQAVLLAPDPDREGEAIAFHLKEILKNENENIYRIYFNEITKASILKALAKPIKIDLQKVNSQQMRRVLDRLAGYKISPVLQKKIGGPLSAGRVQSIALKLIVEREKQIKAFVPEEYWTISVDLEGSKKPVFGAKLEKRQGKKIKIPDKDTNDRILKDLKPNDYVLNKINKRTKEKKPSPPFITSSLQQEAFRRFKFPVKKTMKIAQELYEGISLEGGDRTGLISYMRTDSFRIAATVRTAAKKFIMDTFGKEYYPEKANLYSSKKKIQDAHEAIRPTQPFRPPGDCKPFLSDSQLKLYRLIWERFFASQMKPCKIAETVFHIVNGEYGLSARGEVMTFDGQYKLLKYEDHSTRMPDLQEKEILKVISVVPKQNFTKPPFRYTEASLVKILEEKGIGRPSTYAKIIDTLGKRDYITREDRKFVPTFLGIKVVEYLEVNFRDIMNYNFTAELEKELDQVSEGKMNWVEGIDRFYKKLDKDLERVKAREKIDILVGEKCPECGMDLVKKYSHKTRGWFIGCQGYPKCKYTQSDLKNGEQPAKESVLEEKCPQCAKPLVKRFSRKTKRYFIGCTGFPQCNYLKAIQEELGECPSCKKPLLRRYSKKTRRYFIGCSGYPDCTFIGKG